MYKKNYYIERSSSQIISFSFSRNNSFLQLVANPARKCVPEGSARSARMNPLYALKMNPVSKGPFPVERGSISHHLKGEKFRTFKVAQKERNDFFKQIILRIYHHLTLYLYNIRTNGTQLSFLIVDHKCKILILLIDTSHFDISFTHYFVLQVELFY